MRGFFHNSVLVGIAAIVALLVASAGFAYRNIRQLDEHTAWVAHTHEVLGQTGKVLLTLMYADADQGGFLATGKDEFLQSYQPAFSRLGASLAELKAMSADNARQQVRIDELQKKISGYQDWLQDGIAQRRKGLTEAQMVLILKNGRRQMNAIRDLMADMEREEHVLLKERELESRRAYDVVVTTGFLATALALILIAALFCLLQRSLLARHRAEETTRLANVALTDRVELGAIELNKTTAALSQSDIDLSGSEQLLRQSEERVHELTAHIQQVLWMIDPKKSRVLYVSPGYEQMWGRSCQSVMDNPHSLMEGIHPLDQAMMERENAAMYRTGHVDAEFRVLRPDGSVRWVWSRGYPILEEGRIVRIVGVVEDITEKRRLAMEREALLTRLQLHIERMPLAYVLFDADFRIVDWSKAAERIFGYTREEVLGTGPPFEKFVPRSFWKKAEETRNRIHSGDMEADSINENLTKNGRTITCHWFNTPLMDDHRQFAGLLCLAQDITERKSLEEQFRQAQKMEAVGQLASGVAHDFNNLLTIILGYSELFLNKLPPAHADGGSDPGSQGRAEMVQIRRAGHRAAILTQQLLAFARKQILTPVVLDLNSLMTEVEKMLRRLISADIDLICILQPDLGAVKADAGQVEQIIMNLAINARDAMPTGGRLLIQTSDTVLSETQARRHGDPAPGPYTLLAVSDTGTGMDEATMARIFEPFFTTKDVGKGTGLGLSTVFGIIKQSGGFIEVESVLGSGSTFRMYFPRLQEAVRGKEAHGDLNMPRGAETILLVEDEDGVRELVQLVLEASGYKVLSTRNGGEAVRVCYEYADAIQLLCTDVVMPKMSGRRLTDLLTPLRPDMKVLYMSGYTDDTMLRHGIADEGTNFLAKPFTPVALAQKVRAVLNATNGQPDLELAGRCAPAVAQEDSL